MMHQADPNQTDAPLARQSYSLATLLFAMTVCSLWMLWLVKLPWMAILALLFLLPAITRSIAAVNMRKRQGLQTPIDDKIQILFDSSIFCLTAMLMLGFTWLISSLFFSAVISKFLSLYPYSQRSLGVEISFYLVGIAIGFFIALIPAVIFLYNDWPRVYDVKESRFLSRQEIRQRKLSRSNSSS